MSDPSPGRTGAPATLGALDAVTAALPVHEQREGQREMARRIAEAIESGRHLVVQAGTGTGKTLAYLVPAIVSGKRTVVATATKALQDQLATKDLPFVIAELAEHGIDADWAIVKGRSNYLCLQRLREFDQAAQGQLDLDDMSVITRAEVVKLKEWAGRTRIGDMAELDWAPSDAAWRAVSVGAEECPGGDKCPMGDACFAEAARDRAQVSDVIVVNTHLYGLDVATSGAILPEHDVVVFDEAHGLEDIMSDTVGIDIAPGRFVTLSATVRQILAEPELVASIADLASAARTAFGPFAGQRLGTPLPDPIVAFLTDARGRVERAANDVQAIQSSNDDVNQRKLRAMVMIGRTLEYLDVALAERENQVPFVSGARTIPASRSRRSTSDPPCRAGCGRSAPRCSPAPRCRRRSLHAWGSRPDRPTRPTSAARSTTTSRRCCIARSTCRTRRHPGTGRPSPTRSWRWWRRPAGGRWRCSPAGRPWTTRSRPPARASRYRS